MEKEFIPYEQALALKELGFEYISTIFAYDQSRKLYTRDGIPHDFNIRGLLSAPTFSQAFRWFREKYGLEGVVQQAEDFTWYKWKISQYNEDGKKYVADWYEYKTYEEAELECLKKLIEIVKNK